MKNAILINPTTKTVSAIELSYPVQLDKMYELCECDTITFVSNDDYNIVCDDNGLLKYGEIACTDVTNLLYPNTMAAPVILAGNLLIMGGYNENYDCEDETDSDVLPLVDAQSRIESIVESIQFLTAIN